MRSHKNLGKFFIYIYIYLIFKFNYLTYYIISDILIS